MLNVATSATAQAGQRPPATWASGTVVTFRVDVSRYPQVGMVVTVPGPLRGPAGDDFTVIAAGHSVRPSVRRLSPGDIELVLAPDAAATSARLDPQWAAAARFIMNLLAGAQMAVVDPSRPGKLAQALSRDPAGSVAQVAAPTDVTPVPAATRLATALSVFTRGSRVRRTVVLAIAADEPLPQGAAVRFREQLAASGTALYVLDAAPQPASGYDSLAAGSGGAAIRIHGATDWMPAFGQIIGGLSRQYYLRFIDRARLPGRADVLVQTSRGLARVMVSLPAANPVPPSSPFLPIVPPVIARQVRWDQPLLWLAALLVIIGVGYGLGMLAMSRREPRRRGSHAQAVPGKAAGPLHAVTEAAAAPGRPASSGIGPAQAGPYRLDTERASGPELFFVFLMPCLNEEKVLPNSLRRLLSIPGGNFVVMVIDDGSDDQTVDAISGMLGERVWLLSRKPPHARQGKGEALNAAIRHLTGSGLLDGHDPANVITVVVDADGRLDLQAVARVTPFFNDPAVGAVQIGVRINNRDRSRLARMQDIEFVVYTEVFQRGRRHLGSVGLGGNGQFVRLSALLSLGPAPWTRSLTDDLDLGVRLIAGGWRNEYCGDVAVHQQGVVELRRLIRQRSRWFQGHLQSWKLIPLILRRVPARARTDLFYHLTGPAILLIASLLSASFLVSLVDCVVLGVEGRNPFGWWLATTYALTFGPALLYSYVYWARERDNGVSLLRAAWFAHLYVCYGMLWYASGWWAVARTLRGQTGWAKTDRVAEAPAGQPVAASAGAPGIARTAAGNAPTRPGAGEKDSAPAGPPWRAGDRLSLPALADGRSGGRPTRREADGPSPLSPGVPSQEVASAPLLTGPPRQPGRVPSPSVSALTSEAPVAARPHRGRRRRIAVLTAAVVACAVLGTVLTWPGILGGGTGRGQWLPVFNGYGHTSVTGSGTAALIGLSPAQARTPQATHAALVISAEGYGDFVATLHLRTLRQLRQGAAGTPNPWEVAWVTWHYTSNQRFYALTLEAHGWVLSKQDPAYPGGERFLASGDTPRFRVGAAHSVGIVQIGRQISVSADGQLLTRFTDMQRPYLHGAFGVYTEDADAQFSHIRLHTLPAGPPTTGQPRQESHLSPGSTPESR